MATAAVTARAMFVRSRPRSAIDVAFDELGGPVVLLRGVTGGAGTTTLALLLARYAASASSSPVLVAETRAGSGLALQAGRATPHTLAALASSSAAGETPREAFAELSAGLHFIATADRTAGAPATDLGPIIEQARAAHGLVVLDGSTDAEVDGVTHRALVVPATPHGVSALRHAAITGVDLVIAVARDAQPRASVRSIRRALAGRCRKLVLVPYSAPLARGHSDDEVVADAVARIATTIRGSG